MLLSLSVDNTSPVVRCSDVKLEYCVSALYSLGDCETFPYGDLMLLSLHATVVGQSRLAKTSPHVCGVE